jgi:hypothetical protein
MPDKYFPTDQAAVALADGDYLLLADVSDSSKVKKVTAAGVKTYLDGAYLNLANTTPFTPTADYHPATKKYVDDQLAGENLWDRAGTTLSPHTSNDSVNLGTGTITCGEAIVNGSFSTVQNGDTFSITGDGTDWWLKPSDGYLYVQTTEANTATFVIVRGSGSGQNGYLRAESSDNINENIYMTAGEGGTAVIQTGSGITQLNINNSARDVDTVIKTKNSATALVVNSDATAGNEYVSTGIPLKANLSATGKGLTIGDGTNADHYVEFRKDAGNWVGYDSSENAFCFQSALGKNLDFRVNEQTTLGAGTLGIRINAAGTEVSINDGSVDMDFRVESNGNANMFFVDGGNDKVYVGHNANVYSVATVEVNKSNTYSVISLNGFSDSVSHVPFFQFLKSHHDDIGNLTTTIDTEGLGTFVFKGVDSGGNIDEGAYIKAVQDGAAGAKLPTNLILATYSATTENANQLVLHNDGMIGILTADPDANLDIVSANTTKDVLQITASSLTTGNGLNIYSNSSDASGRYLAKLFNDHASAVGTVCLYIRNDAPLTSGSCLAIESHAAGNNYAAKISNDYMVNGALLLLKSNSADVNARSLFEIHNDHASAVGTSGIKITMDAGNAIDVISGTSYLCDVYPKADNTHYLGKNDDDSPFAWKGLILKDQGGTGKYYRLEVYGDAVRIVDLTD